MFNGELKTGDPSGLDGLGKTSQWDRLISGSLVSTSESHEALRAPLLWGERVLPNSIRGEPARYQAWAGQNHSKGCQAEEPGSVSVLVARIYVCLCDNDRLRQKEKENVFIFDSTGFVFCFVPNCIWFHSRYFSQTMKTLYAAHGQRITSYRWCKNF